MAVVVIVAILAMVALPAYQNYVIRANRAMTKSYLLDAAQMQQLFFNDTRSYAGSANELNSEIPERVTANYQVVVDLSTISAAPQFLITATPLASSIQAGDGPLTIDQAGEKDHDGEPW